MKEGTATVLTILALFLLVLTFKPDLVGFTAGSLTFTESLNDIWSGLGLFTQTAILFVGGFALLAFIISKGD